MSKTPTDPPAWLKPHGRPWKRGETRRVYDNPWLQIDEIDAIAPTGRPALYGQVSFKNLAIAVLPLHDDGTVTLVGQNRFPLGDYSWEIPEGGAPLDEDPLEAGKRELREETGLIAGDWKQILSLQLSNSVTNELGVGFLATDLTPGPTEPDDTEDLAIVRVPFREALAAAVAGHIQDALTVAMLLRAHHMAVTGELPGALSRLVLESDG
ncbi:MAG: DNA mismatch repair protein MutT [Caulobacterales bacterium 68-7]|nr:NUDIX hydrolase [Caulobacterales bacterium]OJU10458.1 MAG: DNA mismatch repair protein MutT [Caulobacterales bacterium 68-7]